MIGGLLSLYWDSGAVVAPPVVDPGLPLGVENTARPNVRFRPNAKPTPAPAPEQSVEDAVPVPLLVRPPTARAVHTVHAAQRTLSRTQTRAQTAGAAHRVPSASAALVLVEVTPATARGQRVALMADASVVSWTVLAEEQKKRNLKAMAAILSLIDEE